MITESPIFSLSPNAPISWGQGSTKETDNGVTSIWCLWFDQMEGVKLFVVGIYDIRMDGVLIGYEWRLQYT